MGIATVQTRTLQVLAPVLDFFVELVSLGLRSENEGELGVLRRSKSAGGVAQSLRLAHVSGKSMEKGLLLNIIDFQGKLVFPDDSA